MEAWLAYIINYLLTQSWQIAVLTIIVVIATFVLKNRSAHVRYLLWLIVLAKCLVPPVHSIPLAILPREQSPALASEQPQEELLVAESRPVQPTATKPVGTTSVQTGILSSSSKVTERPVMYNSRTWLAVGWFAGVIALFCYYLLNALRTQVWLHKRRMALSAESMHEIKRFFSRHKAGHLPNIWLIDGMSQPFVWGLLRGSVYLPAGFFNVKESEYWKALLGHELIHVARLDAAVNSLQIIAQIVFWFHPFVWWTNKKIRLEREKCCDEMIIASLNTLPEDYSEAIVETLASKYKSTRIPSLAVASPVKNIEERIETMLRPGKNFYKRPSLIAAVIVLSLAFLTVPTAFVLISRAGTEAIGTETDTWHITASGNIIAYSNITLIKVSQDANLMYVKLPYSSAVLESALLNDEEIQFDQVIESLYELELPIGSLLEGSRIECIWSMPLETLEKADYGYRIKLQGLIPAEGFELTAVLEPGCGFQYTKDPSQTQISLFKTNRLLSITGNASCGLVINMVQ